MSDPIELNFRWPAGLQLAVVTSREEVQEQGDQRREWAAATRFGMWLGSLDEGGWQMRVGPPERKVLAHADPLQGVFDHRHLLDRLKDELCSFVLAADGQAVSVIDGRGVREVTRPPKPFRKSYPQLAQLVEELTADEALLGYVQGFWNPLVGTWVGQRVVPGMQTSWEVEQPLPWIEDRAVRTQVTVGCAELDDDGFATLQARTEVTPAAVAEVAPGVHLELTTQVELRCDLQTLVPVSASSLSRRVLRQGGEEQVTAERRTWTVAPVQAGRES